MSRSIAKKIARPNVRFGEWLKEKLNEPQTTDGGFEVTLEGWHRAARLCGVPEEEADRMFIEKFGRLPRTIAEIAEEDRKAASQ